MKKTVFCMIIFQTAFSLFAPAWVHAESADRAHCKVWWAVVKDPAPPLNMRKSPEVRPDNVIGTLENGKWLSVKEENEGWFRVGGKVEGAKDEVEGALRDKLQGRVASLDALFTRRCLQALCMNQSKHPSRLQSVG